MQPLDLLKSAEALLASNKNKPSQANLRRATSAAYYALFHTLARNSANLFVGGIGAQKSRGAWRQVYRGLDHRTTKDACNSSNGNTKALLLRFPAAIQDFANAFFTLQEKRHSADYDPYAKFTKSGVKADIALARTVIDGFNNESAKDKRAFCVHALFKRRS